MTELPPVSRNRRDKETTTMDMISAITPEAVRDLLQSVGFRAEIVTRGQGGAVLRSASNGVNFEGRLFTPLPGQIQGPVERYADLTFIAGLHIQGQLNAEIVNRWNMNKRFGRLYLAHGALVLAMDVLLQEGVSERHLLAQLGLWDRLIQDLLIYLRTEATAPAAPAVAAVSNGHAESSMPVPPPESVSGAHDEAAGSALQ